MRVPELEYHPMRALLAFPVVFLLNAPLANASELGTRDDALSLIARVQQEFVRDGSATTFRAINAKAAQFLDRDLYVFVYDMNGVVLAHGENPQLVGENRIDLRDQDGKFIERVYFNKGL